MFLKASGRKSVPQIFYVGAGDFSWIESKANKINELFPNKKFILYGLVGENCETKMIKMNNVEIHHLCSFKIEYMLDEFLSMGINAINLFDLIISSSTLHHLSDPLGTLQQMAMVTKPDTGFIISDSFSLALKDHQGNDIDTISRENGLNEFNKIFSYIGNHFTSNVAILVNYFLLLYKKHPLIIILKYL